MAQNGAALIIPANSQAATFVFFLKSAEYSHLSAHTKIWRGTLGGGGGKIRTGIEWQKHEAVRQRPAIQFLPSIAVTSCLVSLDQHIADGISSQLPYTVAAEQHLHPFPGHDSRRSGLFRSHTGPGFHPDPA